VGWQFNKVRRRIGRPLSDSARDVLSAAAAYYVAFGTHATLRQIMADTGIVSTSTTRYQLSRLADAGYIDRIERGTAHVYVPTEAGLTVARGWQNGED